MPTKRKPAKAKAEATKVKSQVKSAPSTPEVPLIFKAKVDGINRVMSVETSGFDSILRKLIQRTDWVTVKGPKGTYKYRVAVSDTGERTYQKHSVIRSQIS